MGDKDNNGLEYMFHPRSIAVVGVSSDPNNFMGQGFLGGLKEFGYRGELYPINPKASEIMGLKAYANVREVPGPVDYVISMVPAPLTLQLVDDCGAKGVKVLHLFTAGFSETGDEEGGLMEKELVTRAGRTGLRIIGPNCMGIHYASERLTFNSGIQDEMCESGVISFLSQSGGNAVGLVHGGPNRGLRFNKIVSYGNAIDINESELMEHFATDPETEVIAAYIEGVKDGRRFQRVLRETAKAKPLILLKGGVTEAGTGAVNSHTGSLAGSSEMWDWLVQQAGAIRVYSMDELIDLLVAFSFLPPAIGRSAGIIGIGGGASVEAADLCESMGLQVPPLPMDVRKRLREFTPEAGTSVRNPVDTISMFFPEYFARTMEIVAQCPAIDFLIISQELGMSFLQDDMGKRLLNSIVETAISTADGLEKPVFIVPRFHGAPNRLPILGEVQARYLKEGFAVFPSIKGAALAINRFVQYQERRVTL
jgi:acyl-CoA synthetase (NDP forming)